MYCKECGKEINANAVMCVNCGVPTQNQKDNNFLATLLLCWFLGAFGIHRFYTGYVGIGVAQLLLTLSVFGVFISATWALVDLICIIANKYTTKDGKALVK